MYKLSALVACLCLAQYIVVATSATEVCLEPEEKVCFTVKESGEGEEQQVPSEVCNCNKDEVNKLNDKIEELQNQLRTAASNPHELFCPLGMKSGQILDSQLSDSSHRHHAKKSESWSSATDARLDTQHTNDKFGGWHPASNAGGYYKQWIQVDLLKNTKVTGIVTQGRAHGDKYEQWATTFWVRYGDEEENLEIIRGEGGKWMVFDGNVDRNSKKMNFFPESINTRYIRIVARSWNRVPVLRIELLGC